MPTRFTLTILLSAALLFTVEPLVGKALLPLAGGTPAVWTTCLLFFQAALLAGYTYAHALARLRPRVQALIHVPVITVALVSLPIVIKPDWFVEINQPVLGLLAVLARTIGLPFFALATTAPLMQRWFAAVDPKRDPYPLYAASNAGSLFGLAAYPFVIEPALGLTAQGRWWTYGYLIFGLLVTLCARDVHRRAVPGPARPAVATAAEPWLR